MTSKELKNRFIELVTVGRDYNGKWDTKKGWIKYYNEDIFCVVELEDGRLLEIEKPQLETSFCFGYGYFGSYNEPSEAEKAREDFLRTEQNFIDQNTKSTIRRIKAIKEDNAVLSFGKHYADKTGVCGTLIWVEKFDKSHRSQLSDNDRNKVLQAFEDLKQYIEKRCKTYLKRYGTSKLHTWTYWTDN